MIAFAKMGFIGAKIIFLSTVVRESAGKSNASRTWRVTQFAIFAQNVLGSAGSHVQNWSSLPGPETIWRSATTSPSRTNAARQTQMAEERNTDQR